MKILLIDNDKNRHVNHRKMINNFEGHDIVMKEDCSSKELEDYDKSARYNIYIVHSGNHKAYRHIFNKKPPHHCP